MLRVFNRVFAPTVSPIAIRYCSAGFRSASCSRIGGALPLHLLVSHARLFSSSPAENETNFGDYAIIFPPDPPVWGISHIVPRTVPEYILRPPYVKLLENSTSSDPEDPYLGDPYDGDGRISLHSQAEASLRVAAMLARDTLQWIGPQVQPGVTTNALDARIHDFIISHSAYPSPLHYGGFPRSCCTSVNNIVVHGIPDDRALEDGDIVNIDVTVYLNGYHGDTSRTFLVGQVDELGIDLVNTTQEALEAGIRACGPGELFKNIGHAIQQVAYQRGYAVSSQFSGHGIGPVFHRPPWILHHRNDEPGFMQPGHCFTIEPCLIQGSNPRAWIFPDGWTASTESCGRSAQAEHMVLITETGFDVLTR